jgi:O-antigen ligase
MTFSKRALFPFDKTRTGWVTTFLWAASALYLLNTFMKSALVTPDMLFQDRIAMGLLITSVTFVGAHISALIFVLPAFWRRARNIGLHPLVVLLLMPSVWLFGAWLTTQIVGYSYNAPTQILLYIAALGGLVTLLCTALPSGTLSKRNQPPGPQDTPQNSQDTQTKSQDPIERL